MNLKLPYIYPITDARLSGLSHEEQVTQFIAGGAEFVQLREKYAPPREFYESSRSAVEIARRHNVTVVINDRVDLALALKAGVHLGQDDLPPEAARRILGPDAIIGSSTHSVRQAILAVKRPVDYLAIGPIFRTETKENPDKVVGLTGLKRVRDAIGDFPLVAIGGIDADNVKDVLAAGADSVAIIGAILSNPTRIAFQTRRLYQIASK